MRYKQKYEKKTLWILTTTYYCYTKLKFGILVAFVTQLFKVHYEADSFIMLVEVMKISITLQVKNNIKLTIFLKVLDMVQH